VEFAVKPCVLGIKIMAKKKKVTPPSLIVTQSNKLIEARYNLSLGEQRLVMAMIAQVQPGDEDFKPYRINIAEFADFLGIDKSSAYRECKKLTKKLLSRVIEIQEDDRFIQVTWAASAEYVDGSGAVDLACSPLLMPYLLNLQRDFTSCKLDILMRFKSQYTLRMYMLLKQYVKLAERKIEIGLLRAMLGLRKDQHVEYSDFKRNILNSVQKELQAKADLYFEFDEIKSSRRVVAINFHILHNKLIEATLGVDPQDVVVATIPALPAPTAKIASPQSELLLLIPPQHQALKTVNTAIESYEKKHGFAYVKRNILYSNAKAAKSYAGFLNNALKNDWGCDWELEQKPVPEKKKVPEIWERSGFKTKEEFATHLFTKHMESLAK